MYGWIDACADSENSIRGVLTKSSSNFTEGPIRTSLKRQLDARGPMASREQSVTVQ